MDETKIKKIIRGLRDVAQKFVARDALDFSVAYMAYMLFRSCTLNGRYLMQYDLLRSRENLPDDVAAYVNGLPFGDFWPELAPFVVDYTAQDFADGLNAVGEGFGSNPMQMGTPNALCRLAIVLLKLKNGDNVLDVGSGCGNFLTQAMKTSKVGAVGVETDKFAAMISGLRLSGKANVICGDAFEKTEMFGTATSYKVFSNYPFVARAKALGENAERYSETLSRKWNLRKNVYSSDWLFNVLLCDLMGPKGRAVAIMSAGSAWKENDADVRGAIVNAGLVECVVELPAGAIPGTAINTCLVVFSRGNKAVRLVDAREMGTRVRSFVNLDGDVDAILENVKSAKTVNNAELEQNGYCILPSRFAAENAVAFASAHSSVNSRPLGEFAKLSRGAIFSAAELAIAECKNDTGMLYLKPANLVDGEITGEMANVDLSRLDRKVNENLYCAKEQTLVMTKYGSPLRIAVVHDTSHKLLVNSNLYMLNIDTSVALPDYVKLFLESSCGQALVAKTLVGSVMLSVDQKALMNIPVPLPTINEQKSFVKKYGTVKAQLDKYKALLEETREKIRNLIDAEMQYA